jgi:hypothetical protein
MIHHSNKTPINLGSLLLGAFFLYLILPSKREPAPHLTPEQRKAKIQATQHSDGATLILWFTFGMGSAAFVAFILWFVHPLLGIAVIWLYVIGSVKLVGDVRKSKRSELKQSNPTQIIFRTPPWISSRTDEIKNVRHK